MSNLEEDIESELKQLPPDLESTYTKIYEQVSYLPIASRAIAERSLKWLLCAQRRLSVEEFLAAVSVGAEGTITTKLSKERVLDICYNLVIFDTELSVFRFAHLSVREFLIKREFTHEAAHALAAERCLRVCLSNYDDPAPKDAPAANNNFETYATVYCAIHWSMSGDHQSEGNLENLVRKFVLEAGEDSLFAKWTRSVRETVEREAGLNLSIKRRVISMISDPPDPFFAVCV
jgi:hypothetical protein